MYFFTLVTLLSALSTTALALPPPINAATTLPVKASTSVVKAATVAPVKAATTLPIKVATTTARASSAVIKAAPVYPTPAYDGGYLNTVLKHHNVHRANHSAPALVWGTLMAEWAQVLAERCVFAHNTTIGTKPYGQNIAAGTQPANISQIISDEFYNGEVNAFAGLYGQQSPDMSNFGSWVHFSQVVWKGTQTVGCATVNCAAKGGISNLQGMGIEPWMTVCNYYPPGNYLGEFADGVGESLGRGTVTGYY